MTRLANRSKRRPLRLALAVSGEDFAGAPFTERAFTVNVSGGGLAFEARRLLPVGAKLVLGISIPRPLRRYFAGRDVYRVRAVVCRVERRAIHVRVGVRFLGEVS